MKSRMPPCAFPPASRRENAPGKLPVTPRIAELICNVVISV